MRKVTKPNIAFSDVFDTCISNLGDKKLKVILENTKIELIKNNKNFTQLVEKHECFLMEEPHLSTLSSNSGEIKKLYTQKLVPKTSPGRKFYDEILAAPRNGICPLCGERIVYTLDHYLNKSTFPSLSITPENLVPACRDCNTDKLAYSFKSKEDETLHPYYDDLGDTQWLECLVNEDIPISFTFRVKNIATGDTVLQKRIRKHFEVYKLQRLYSLKASQEVAEIEENLKSLFSASGVDSVKKYINEEIKSRIISGVNHWKVVLYKGLLESEWFLTKWLSGNC